LANIFYDKDADLQYLQGKKIAVMGYGSQGHAQAQNLKDSGLNVTVGLRKDSKSWQVAEKDGLKVTTVSEAAAAADVIMMLVSDSEQPRVYKGEILPFLTEGKAFAVAHGFQLVYNQIIPPKNVDVFMVAPKSPGHILRRMYQKGVGVPALVAVEQDYTGKCKEVALAYAKGIGSTKAGVLETTLVEETETDLFGEQAILCGGISALIKASFDTLVEAGYQPEVAYFECLNELKLIVDLIFEGGLPLMRYSVSDTAEYGDLTRGPRIINESVRQEMRNILEEIQSGAFAVEMIQEYEMGKPRFTALRRRESQILLEKVGSKLREMMPWIKEIK